ncbi:hypothetical protein, partial [Oceanidesulfovibrio marinus]|uniref:hypothetical protein n=1 Tax=Oceanidesulfovibrio marinus TaxID=370038 RepID=UPI001ABFA269
MLADLFRHRRLVLLCGGSTSAMSKAWGSASSMPELSRMDRALPRYLSRNPRSVSENAISSACSSGEISSSRQYFSGLLLIG